MIGLKFKSDRASSGMIRHLLALLSITCLLSSAAVSATDAAGAAYLCTKSKEAEVVTLPSGLLYRVIESGDGAFHPAIDSKTVCHYAGTLIDGTTFDSSYARGAPATFAPNQVIRGWTEAMQLMVEGDRWELYIPSDLAYGSRGSEPSIPGDAALVFTIEMIEIQGGKVPAGDDGGESSSGATSPYASCSSDISDMEVMSAASRREMVVATAFLAFVSISALV